MESEDNGIDCPPPIANPSKATSNYRLRSRDINPQGVEVNDKRKSTSDTWRHNTTKGPAKKARTADRNSHCVGDNGGQPRRHPATTTPREVTLGQDDSAPSQFTTGSQPEHCSPCPTTPMDFCPAPTTKRPRGVELDFDEGNLTKAGRVELPIDDDMDLDCEMLDTQVSDSGFIHSLS